MKIKLFKLFLTVFVGLGLVISAVSQAKAVDLTVTCAENGPCTTAPASGAELFYETNWLPGDSVNRSITVINQDNDESCNLALDTKNETQNPSNFASRLFTVIKQGAADIFGVRNGSAAATSSQNLDSLYAFGPIFLGTISPSSSQNYQWAVTFDSASGNEYQNAQTVFDFDLAFTCDGTVLSSDVCVNIDGIQTSVPADHHLDASGLNCVQFQLGGAPGSGGSGGGGSVLGAATEKITRFFRPVLGAFKEEIEEVLEPTPTPTSTPEPEVKGEETAIEVVCGKYFRWWIPLVIQFVATIVYVLYVLWRNKQNKDDSSQRPQLKRFILVPVIFAILSQIAHFIIGCPCVLTVWCKWYWLFNLIIFLLSPLLYKLFIEKETSGN